MLHPGQRLLQGTGRLLVPQVQIPLGQVGLHLTGDGQAGEGAPLHHRAHRGGGPHHPQGGGAAPVQGELHHVGLHRAQQQVDPPGGVLPRPGRQGPVLHDAVSGGGQAGFRRHGGEEGGPLGVEVGDGVLYRPAGGAGEQARVLRHGLQPAGGGAVPGRRLQGRAGLAAPHQVEGGVQAHLHIPQHIVQGGPQPPAGQLLSRQQLAHVAEIEVGGPLALEAQHRGAEGGGRAVHHGGPAVRPVPRPAGGGDGHLSRLRRVHPQGLHQLHVLDLPAAGQRSHVPAAARQGEEQGGGQEGAQYPPHRWFLRLAGWMAAGRHFTRGRGRRISPLPCSGPSDSVAKGER